MPPQIEDQSTDLSTTNQPAGTTRIEDGVAYDISGKALGPANTDGQSAQQPTDLVAAAKAAGATHAPVDLIAAAKAAGATPISQAAAKAASPVDLIAAAKAAGATEQKEDLSDPYRALKQATGFRAGPNTNWWDALKSGEFMEFYGRAKNWLNAATEDVDNGTNQTVIGSLLKSMGSHGTREAQQFSEQMRDQVLGTTPKTPTQQVMRSIGRTAAGALTSPMDWVADVAGGATRASKVVPGALEATGAAVEGDEDKALHSTIGAFNDLVGGGFRALTPIISVMYPASLAEGGLSAAGPQIAKEGTTLASAMGMQFAGQVLAADMGADEDVQEAVGNVFGLATFKAFHNLFAPDQFEKFGHQFNDYTNTEAAYRSSAKELAVQRSQVRAAQIAADEAAAAEKAGTGSAAQTIAARQTASEASASALKAQKKFELASAARANAKVEIDKTATTIERAMEKERQKANGRSSEVAQVATDSWNKFSRAIPSTGARQYAQNDWEVWRNYAEPHHENVEPIMSVRDVAESAEVEREKLENEARQHTHGDDYKNQPLQDTEGGNEALDHVRRSMAERDSVQPGFADRAVSYLQEKFNTTDLTLGEADNLRAELNRLNRAKLKESGWNISDAMASDSNFAAREALNDYLKETIEQRLQDLGVDGVRENRLDQASLVRIRNAAEGLLSRNARAGEVMVRGTGDAKSLGRKGLAWLVKRGAEAGGAMVAGPFGAAMGGAAVEPILDRIIRPNLTRDQAIASSMQDKNGTPIKVATGSPARITAGTPPGAPPAVPLPPIPPEPTPYEPRDKDLHGDMMTYFDKRPGQEGSSYPELIQQVKDEMDIYQKHGIKAADRPAALNDLANRITKEELAEDLERAKEARDRAAKKAEKAATVESVAQEATGKRADETTPADKAKLATEQAAAAAAIPSWDWKELFPFKYTNEELPIPEKYWGKEEFQPFFTRIHELAHQLASKKINMTPGEVLSHLGVEGDAFASALADDSRLRGPDGEYDVNKIKANMGDLLARFVIGGVAEQLHGGARFDVNSSLHTDLTNARELFKILEVPEAKQNELLRDAIQQAHEWLTEPGVKELMERYSRQRIEGTPETHHFTQDHIDAFSNALDKLSGEGNEPTKPRGKAALRDEAGVREGAAVVREGAASGGKGEAKSRLGVEQAKGAEQAEGAGILEKAIAHYGTTDEPRKIGYILPDGRGLDFSDGQAVRTLDHGDVTEVMHSPRGENPRDRFVRDTGAARFLQSSYGTEVVLPASGATPEMAETIARAIEQHPRGKTELSVDILHTPEEFEKVAEQPGARFATGSARGEATDIEGVQRVINDARKDAVRRGMKLGTEQAISPEEAAANYEKYQKAQKAAEEKEAADKKAFKRDILGVEKSAHVIEGANTFNAKHGRPEVNPETPAHDPEFAKRVADAYEAMQHNPEDPAVKKSYNAMLKEVRQQWDHATKDMGIKLEPWTQEGQPYANSKEMVKDVNDNKHLYFFTGGDISADNPLNKVDPETGHTGMEMFRAVHDLFGHAAHGNEFGPKGEEKAYQLHRQMFSPEAIPALTSETRGQNSWINYGKHLRNEAGEIPKKGEPGYVPATERPYAEQKVGLLPEAMQSATPGPAGEKPAEFGRIEARSREGGAPTKYYSDDWKGQTRSMIDDLKATVAPSNWQEMLADIASDFKEMPRGIADDLHDAMKEVLESAKGRWADFVAKNFKNRSAGGVNPYAPEAESKRYGLELVPEARNQTEKLPTAEEIRSYAERPEVKQALASHPDIKLGWDVGGEKPELNVGVSTDDKQAALDVAKKLDQRAMWDNEKKEEVPVGGQGKKTAFPDYPVEQRLKDLGLGNLEKAAPKENPDIISTAVPTGKNAIADAHAEHVRVGMETIPEKPMAKIATRVREVPGMKIPENIKDPGKVVNRYISQAKDNLKYLYNKVAPETRNANAKWYESAQSIADRISNEHGKTMRQGAGVLAAMSPQKDWNMNVGLAERTMNIYHEQAGESLTPEAKTKANEIGFGGYAARIGDRKLGELTDPLEKAAFIRIWDEAHNDRSFRSVDPATGNYGDYVKTGAGDNYKIAWGSLNEIAKAISIIEDGSRENISRTLGMGHKVRNFYNNIVDPNNPGGHITADTHAVAAAQMRPLGGEDPEIQFHFGKLSAAQTGLKGMYPVHAEAYRQAANELGIQPRQLQSVVWEEIRRLFSADLKSDPDARDAINGIWKQYEDGKLSIDKARDAIYDYAQKYGEKLARDRAEGKRQTSFGWGDIVQPSTFANIGGAPEIEGAGQALRGLNLSTEQSAPRIPPQAAWDNYGPKTAPGLVARGNIDLSRRPIIQNADGSHSSEYSTSFEDEDGKEVLVPTVVNGRFLTPDGKKPAPGSPAEKTMFKAAWDHYKKTGQHMGKFDTPEHADAYAQAVHNRKQ